jgi:sRNA-binding protein
MLRLMVRPALLVLVLAIGCGPITYIGAVPRGAVDSIEAARAAQADKYAPYWWTRATQYLHMAREDAARADFQGANRFGRLAEEAADKATAEAIVAAKDPSKRPIVLPTKPIAPAKEDAPPAKRVAPAKDTP